MGWKTDTVAALAVFCVFVVSMLITLVFGGSVYKNIVRESKDGTDERTCLSYLWAKVKNGDEAGSIYPGDFNGLSALFLEKEYDQVMYQTVIYQYDDWVRELFFEKGLDFAPEDGMAVIQVDSLSFEQLDGGLIKAKANAETVLLYPRGGTRYYVGS